jgi:hypothetical protein
MTFRMHDATDGAPPLAARLSFRILGRTPRAHRAWAAGDVPGRAWLATRLAWYTALCGLVIAVDLTAAGEWSVLRWPSAVLSVGMALCPVVIYRERGTARAAALRRLDHVTPGHAVEAC